MAGTVPPAGDVSGKTARRRALLCALLALLTLAVFHPVIGFEFIAFDDPGYVSANPVVDKGLTSAGVRWAFAAPHQANYHPLTWLSHMLDVELFGMRPGGHHLTSLLLHTAATLLLFLALEALTGAMGRSAAVAALFAVHPAHVESVAWVSERKDVLCAFFWFLSILAYAGHARRPGPGRMAAVLPAFAAGLLSKPMAVTLPAALLLLDFWPLGRLVGRDGKLRRAVLVEKVPFLALSLSFSLLTIAAQARGAMPSLERYALATRLEKALLACGEYLAKAVWPVDLAVFYPQPLQRPPLWVFLAWGVLVATISVASFRTRRRYPYLPVGWIWFLATIFPVLGLLQAGAQFVADRYTYIPYVGLFAAAAWGAYDLLRRAGGRRAAATASVALAAAILCALGLTARAQVGHWRDGSSLFRHAIAVTEDNSLAHLSLGISLDDSGERTGARHHYEEALRINPESAIAHFNLGVLLDREGESAAAAGHYRRATELDPAFASPFLNLAELALRNGDRNGAEALLRAAVAADPGDAIARTKLGFFLAAAGRPGEAVSHLERAVDLSPADAAAHFNLGAALEAAGDADGAVRRYRRSLALRPDDADTRNNLGVALAKLGLREEARAQFEAVLRLAPGHRGAADNLRLLTGDSAAGARSRK